MNSYVAYGLGIHSEIEFPELTASSSSRPAGVVVRVCELGQSYAQNGTVEYTFENTADGMYRFWEDVGTILISN